MRGRSKFMHIGIIGVGGVGGYFGGKLARLLTNNNDKLKIYFFARGKHLDEIKKNGLLLSTQNEGEFFAVPTLATDNINELPELDLCLLCVKSPDLNNVLSAIKRKIRSDTHIIPLLNGIDIYERVKKVIPEAIVYPACAYLGTHIERYGKVTQNGGSCTILFGKDPTRMQAESQVIFDLFNAANIKHRFLENPYLEIWAKYIFIAAYGMVAASENLTLGQIMDNIEMSNLVKEIMKELVQIAEKQGVKLPKNIIDESFNKSRNFPADTKTSFQRDFEKDGLNESELFGDTIIRLGKKLGVRTSFTIRVNDKLKKIKMGM
jgi:2-dehydropantoate 2-reductase